MRVRGCAELDLVLRVGAGLAGLADSGAEATAGGALQQSHKQRFESLDGDHDGFLSPSEAVAALATATTTTTTTALQSPSSATVKTVIEMLSDSNAVGVSLETFSLWMAAVVDVVGDGLAPLRPQRHMSLGGVSQASSMGDGEQEVVDTRIDASDDAAGGAGAGAGAGAEGMPTLARAEANTNTSTGGAGSPDARSSSRLSDAADSRSRLLAISMPGADASTVLSFEDASTLRGPGTGMPMSPKFEFKRLASLRYNASEQAAAVAAAERALQSLPVSAIGEVKPPHLLCFAPPIQQQLTHAHA